MQSVHDIGASKKATNLRVNADLVDKAKALNINLSSTLEEALVAKLREKTREQWLAENRQAIDAYNRRVEEAGTFSDGLRKF
jgi:antitoxin CcdA